MNFDGTVVGVELGERSYPIYIGAGILERLGEALQCRMQNAECRMQKEIQNPKSKIQNESHPSTLTTGRTVVVTDENVEKLYGERAEESLRAAGFESHRVSVAAGEASKRMEVVERVYERLFDLAVARSDTIVALGGGVVGDLAGFVAATFKRGVHYVQVPTTLLAMVDSSIGGKTGINHPQGKNMIGAFYQPGLVLADTATLATLPRRELGCGLAETVKHAVIRDAAFFAWLEANAAAILRPEAGVMTELVERNCRIKAAVVSADERESKLRGILNFGHTIGHTLETVLPERDYHHGEAVSLGMAAAGRIAVRRGMIGESDAERIARLLRAFGLPTAAREPLPADKLLTAMKQDKKVRAGRVQFVLPTRIGDCTFVEDLSEGEIRAAIESLYG
jgi:3-dehydroquinate synthase